MPRVALVSVPGGSRWRGCSPGCLPSKPAAAWAMCNTVFWPCAMRLQKFLCNQRKLGQIDANNDASYMTALATSSADITICTIFSTDSSKAWIAEWKPMFMFICHQILYNSTVIYTYFLNVCKQVIFAVGPSILRDRGTKIWARVSDTGCRTK